MGSTLNSELVLDDKLDTLEVRIGYSWLMAFPETAHTPNKKVYKIIVVNKIGNITGSFLTDIH